MKEIIVNIDEYFTEDELKAIYEDEIRAKFREEIQNRKNDHADFKERVLINSSYHMVWDDIEEIMGIKKDEVVKIIEDKVIEIINGLSTYSVFREKDSICERTDSLATTYLKQSVENNKELIDKRVKDLFGDFDVNLFRQDLDNMIYECIQNRLFGDKE